MDETAHMLKGGSGYMGAARMVKICAGIQGLVASGELSRAPELLDDLEEGIRTHPPRPAIRERDEEWLTIPHPAQVSTPPCRRLVSTSARRLCRLVSQDPIMRKLTS